jgi:hypothetical protein
MERWRSDRDAAVTQAIDWLAAEIVETDDGCAVKLDPVAARSILTRLWAAGCNAGPSPEAAVTKAKSRAAYAKKRAARMREEVLAPFGAGPRP